MRPAEKVVITTAVTGSVNVPSQSPYLPLSADEVADAAAGGDRRNAEQVRKIRAAVADLGKQIATPAEARAMLALRGPVGVGPVGVGPVGVGPVGVEEAENHV